MKTDFKIIDRGTHRIISILNGVKSVECCFCSCMIKKGENVYLCKEGKVLFCQTHLFGTASVRGACKFHDVFLHREHEHIRGVLSFDG